jgi:hypothetical protein
MATLIRAESEPPRNWGLCTRGCLNISHLQSMEHIATHIVAFDFKHWCVKIVADCSVHGRQTWVVEIEEPTKHATASNQCFHNEGVVMWCGIYETFLNGYEKSFSSLNQTYTLTSIHDIVMSWYDNKYSLIHNNCGYFANQFSRSCMALFMNS